MSTITPPLAPGGDDGFDVEFGVADDPRPLLEEGVYEAACVRAEIIEFHRFGKARKIILHFEIVGGAHGGERVFFPMSALKPGGRVGRGSKLYASYLIANGGKPPGRRDRLSLKVFKHKLFRVRLGTAQPRFEDGKLKPQQFHYSIVSELLERLA